MAILNSPYQNSTYPIRDGSGNINLNREEILYSSSPGDIFHTIGKHDTLLSIAFRYYRTDQLWWLIAAVNDSIIDPFLDLEVGEIIIVPESLNYL